MAEEDTGTQGAGNLTHDQIIQNIGSQLSTSQTLAKDMLARNETFITDLAQLADTVFALDQYEFVPQYEVEGRVEASKPPRPFYRASLGGIPSLPALPSIPNLTASLQIPALDAKKPDLSIPGRPNLNLPTVPTEPTIRDIPIPDKPIVTLPDIPELKDIEIPDAPNIPDLPEFDEELPRSDYALPNVSFNYVENPYQSSLNDLIRAELIEDITEGGTGLGPAYEDAVTRRTIQRTTEAARRDLDTIDQSYASANWPTPPGARDAAQRARLQEHLHAELEVQDKIFIQQTQLAHEYRKFTLATGIDYEGIMINLFNAVADRALAAARATVDAAIALFNARVSDYNARVTAYRIAGEVYLTKIRAALQNVEIYKALLEGKKIEADIQEQALVLYNSQLEGVRTLINLYSTEMEAARIASDVERNKIAVFSEKVGAYRAQVEAKVSEFAAYRAAIDGERAKVDIYRAEVDAYSSRANVKIKEGDLKAREAEVAISNGRLLLQGHEQEISAFRAKIASLDAVFNSTTRVYEADISAYRAETAVSEANANIRVKNAVLKSETARFNAQIANNYALQSFEALKAQAAVQTSAAGSGAQVLATIAGNALSQYQGIAQIMSGATEVNETTTTNDGTTTDDTNNP